METPRAPSHRKRRLRAAALCAFLVASGTLPALHAEPSGSDKATAQVLFDDALKLIAKKQFKEACGKLEESLRLDPQMGTKYRLADCYEQDGRTASAWVTFREVVEDAKAKNLADREKKARERAAKLESKLSRLTIVVDAANGSSLRVKRDGSDVGTGQIGTAVPVDPGSHRIEASAPGKKTWTSNSEVAEGATVSVTVPPLEAATVVPEKVEPPPRRPVETSGGSQKTVGLVVGSVGLVAIGVSTVLIFTAKGLVSDASPHCNGNACDETGLDLRDRAHSRGNVATVIFGLGAAAVVGGGVLWFTGGESTTSTPPVASPSASLGVGPGWLMLRGSF